MKWLLILLLAAPTFAQVSVEQEVALGRRAAQSVEAQAGVDNDPELNARLQRVGQILVPVCGRNDIQYQFKVLNSDEFNAMALPGGFVYATRKLMQVMPDGQLAFVLGHELSHVTRRHSIRQIENDQMRRMGIMAILVGLGGGRVSRESAQLAGLVDQVISSRYSQADEDEADRLGTEMMARAGIDPAYALCALHTLARQHNGGMPHFANAILGSHPLPQDRIEAAYRYIPSLAYSPGPAQAAAAAPSPPVEAPRDWQASLRQALADVGLRADPRLEANVRAQMESREFDSEGVLLVSPGSESPAVLERRLFAGWLAYRRVDRPRSYGLACQTTAAGEKLLWLKVR